MIEYYHVATPSELMTLVGDYWEWELDIWYLCWKYTSSPVKQSWQTLKVPK